MNTFQQLLPQTDTYLYRASGQEAYNQFKRNRNKNRSQISNSTVLSTTIHPRVVMSFMSGEGKVLEIIKIVRGVMPIVLVDSISKYSSEKEVILPFSVKRNIIGVNNYNSQNYELKVDDVLLPKQITTKIYFSIMDPH